MSVESIEYSIINDIMSSAKGSMGISSFTSERGFKSKTDLVSSMGVEHRKGKQDLLEKEKHSYIKLCTQLKRENDLLQKINNLHITEA